MENNQNNQTIDFEEIFKDNNQNEAYNKMDRDEKSQNKNLLVILLYFLLMVVGFGVLIANAIVSNVKPKSVEYVTISKLVESKDKYNVGLISKEKFTDVEDLLSKQNYSIYDVLLDGNLKYSLITLTEDTSQLTFIEENIEGIVTGKVVKWPKNSKDIEHDLVVFFPNLKETATLFKTYNNFYNTGNLTNLKDSLINFIAYIIIFIPLIIIVRRDLVTDFMYFKKEFHPVSGSLLTGFAYMYAASFVLGLIATLLSLLIKTDTTSVNQLAIERILNSNGLIFMLLATVILGPIVEELVFRKAIFGLIPNNKTAIAVSSITFGGIHIVSELSLLLTTGGFGFLPFLNVLVLSIPYIGMGVFLGYWYSRNKRNISLLIGMHMLYNLASVILVLLR